MERHLEKGIGTLALPLRLVSSWLFLAACWRRLVLAPEKHHMGDPGWLGHKMNTFFPHSNFPFHDVLDVLLQYPVALDVFLWGFTLSELVLGLLLLFGVASRFAGIFQIGMAIGLMHTSGWLGPTCLSEWQTASLLISAGAVLALGGAGTLSVDAWAAKRWPNLTGKSWWFWLVGLGQQSGSQAFRKVTVAAAIAGLVYVMAMNQVHHGGVWGSLHNYSKVPDIQVTDVSADDQDTFSFTAFRDKGPEAWGTHVIAVTLETSDGREVHTFDADDLTAMSPAAIENTYVNETVPGKYSLVMPLGSKARLTFDVPAGKRLDPAEDYRVIMTEIGGRRFSSAPSS